MEFIRGPCFSYYLEVYKILTRLFRRNFVTPIYRANLSEQNKCRHYYTALARYRNMEFIRDPCFSYYLEVHKILTRLFKRNFVTPIYRAILSEQNECRHYYTALARSRNMEFIRDPYFSCYLEVYKILTRLFKRNFVTPIYRANLSEQNECRHYYTALARYRNMEFIRDPCFLYYLEVYKILTRLFRRNFVTPIYRANLSEQNECRHYYTALARYRNIEFIRDPCFSYYLEWLKMQHRKSLPASQLYDTRYKTVEACFNKSLDDLYATVRETKQQEKRRLREEEKTRRKELDAYEGRFERVCSKIWSKTFGLFNEDWVFLALLGILVAIISYILDKGVMMCGKARMWLYNDLATEGFAKWIAWICLPICLILFDTGFVNLVSTKAIGSGIPQIKTILRGGFMKEYLTFRCLIAKWVGITSTLGSGMPLGKEGPLIHISCILVTKMGKMIRSFHGMIENRNKTIEMLGAAWAVGVACTFNAPIGGVLFSIEISTSYYAVRNYWRGFFAAVWAATTYRLLSVWIDGAGTITVVFKSSFYVDFPYDPQELFAFAIVGVICGLGGSFYIWCKQNYGSWLKNNKTINHMKKTSIFIYPFCVVILISTIQFPLGIGQFIAASLPPRDQVVELFSNFTWTNQNLNVEQHNVISHWTTKYTGIYVNLVCFICYQFVCSILASTMAIPNGSFIPNFRSGAAIGRIAGELMHYWFPLGVRYKGKITQIMPGAYAMVGAAAFSGAVTHTLSTSVILFEMTSQITHVIPVLISVLIANGIARLLTPSIYDLAIQANKLPYLPDLLPSKSAIYRVYVEDFMIQEVKYIYLGMSYRELRYVLRDSIKLKHFPIVDHPKNMILLGSIHRRELASLLEKHIGKEKRMEILPYGIAPDGEIVQDPEEYDKKLRDEAKKEERERIFEKYRIDPKKNIIVQDKRQKNAMLVRKVMDMTAEQQAAWEMEQLNMMADFSKCRIDPAPFQLVERTSLLKVHSLFSMLAINIAYVTSIGKLVGVVGLKELRKAIEDANNGNLPTKDFVLKPLIPK